MSHLCDNEYCSHPALAHDGERGNCTAEVEDLYGTWQCLCHAFTKSADE